MFKKAMLTVAALLVIPCAAQAHIQVEVENSTKWVSLAENHFLFMY